MPGRGDVWHAVTIQHRGVAAINLVYKLPVAPFGCLAQNPDDSVRVRA